MVRSFSNSLKRPALRVTFHGFLANLALSVLKVGLGLFAHSVALVADGIHSLSDVATDCTVWVGIQLGRRPADRNHPWGHGKFESLAGSAVALVLMALALAIIIKSGSHLYAGQTPAKGFWVLAVAAFSVVVKELLFRKTRDVAREEHSPALLANAWHHRSDALSSVAVLLGAAATLLGWPQAEPIAAIVVGVLILLSSGHILLQSLTELTDSAAEQHFRQELESIIATEKEIASWHAYRSRRVGRQVYVECHILVEPEISVRQSHDITKRMERKLNEVLPEKINLIIHVEPNLPEEQVVMLSDKP